MKKLQFFKITKPTINAHGVQLYKTVLPFPSIYGEGQFINIYEYHDWTISKNYYRAMYSFANREYHLFDRMESVSVLESAIDAWWKNYVNSAL